MTRVRRLVCHARAKVNLDLRVLAVRDDGYHELETVFQTLALHDTLEAVVRPGPLRLTCDTPGVPLDASNLVWRAARAVWTAAGGTGEPEGVDIALVKRIPAEAGLGGGSADAAAALVVLDRLWGGGLDPAQMAALAGRLGADVPYFLEGGTRLGRGRGDRLERLPPLPPQAVLIVRPAFGVRTAEAYAWYDQSRAPASGRARWPGRREEWALALGACRNDLEPAVEARHPEIAALRSALARAGAGLARMSGSGSTVFGLFPSPDAAREAAAALAAPGRTILVTETVDGPACRVSEG